MHFVGLDAQKFCIEAPPFFLFTAEDVRPWRYKQQQSQLILREGVKKTPFFLGLCPKHRTPPTYRARLGLH